MIDVEEKTIIIGLRKCIIVKVIMEKENIPIGKHSVV